LKAGARRGSGRLLFLNVSTGFVPDGIIWDKYNSVFVPNVRHNKSGICGMLIPCAVTILFYYYGFDIFLGIPRILHTVIWDVLLPRTVTSYRYPAAEGLSKNFK